MTQFSKDYQPKKKKPRGKHASTLIKEALEAKGKTEADFWNNMIETAMFGGVHGDGDSVIKKEIAARLAPMHRQTYEPVVIDNFPKDGTKPEQARAILSAVSNGEIPIDVANSMMNILDATSSIEEKEELRLKVDELEVLLNKLQ